MDMTPPPVVTEIQVIKQQMEVMMNALKRRVSSDLDDLVNRTDLPFTASINCFPLPHKFHMSHIDSYDGVKDPLDNLETFKTLMHLQGVAEKIMCRAFPTTLKGAARIWFSRLTPSFISTFKELSAQFTSHFIGGHRYKKSTTCLMNIKQWEDETLRSYITLFNKEALFQLTRRMTRYSWQHSLMGYERVSSYFLCTRMIQRLCRMCFTGPPSI